MLEKAKAFFKFLLSHWVMTLVFLLALTVFLAAPLGRVYDGLKAKVPFLPARRV